jgi:protein arginine kinase activator
MQKLDLCEDCAKAKGVNDPAGFALADLMLGLGASQEIEQAAGGAELKCPRCGFTQADFKKSGRLGCPECYKTFSEGLNGLLKSMHKGTRHVGKAPEALKASRENADKLKTLQKKLAKAIESEKFEEAAHLRDEIKQLGERSTTPKNLTR